MQILQLIHQNLPHLDTSPYADFVRANPEFLELTDKRVNSYWDCYYRSISKKEYPGFLVLDFLKSLAKKWGINSKTWALESPGITPIAEK